MFASPKRGARQNPPSAAYVGGQLSPLLRLEGDDGVELKGSAAPLQSLPASWREQQGKVTPMASFLRSS
jgi:hypothetical protein